MLAWIRIARHTRTSTVHMDQEGQQQWSESVYAQLVEQAQAIAHLARQREFLLQRSIQDRARWNAEREAWDTIAHTLLIQRYASQAQNRGEVSIWYLTLFTLSLHLKGFT